jgi:ribosomal protein S2
MPRRMSHLELTPTEHKIALCLEAGLSSDEIAETLGRRSPRMSGVIITVRSKMRAIKLNQQDEERRKAAGGFSSLSRAHGKVRMEGTK